MISTGGALSPQGPTWAAAAKSTLPGFHVQVGGHEGGLLGDLPEDKQRGSMVGPQSMGAAFLGLSGKKDLDTPQLWRAQGLGNHVAPSCPPNPLLSKSWCAVGVLL